MSISQWLCEHQVFASIVMTILSIGLFFVLVSLPAILREKLGKKETWDEYAARIQKENGPEEKAKKEKREKTKDRLMLGFYLAMCAWSIYDKGLAQTVPVFLLSLIFLIPFVICKLEKNHEKLSKLIWYVFFVCTAIFAIGALIYMGSRLYDWWILHICHF